MPTDVSRPPQLPLPTKVEPKPRRSKRTYSRAPSGRYESPDQPELPFPTLRTTGNSRLTTKISTSHGMPADAGHRLHETRAAP
jgi:hypothetical protein